MEEGRKSEEGRKEGWKEEGKKGEGQRKEGRRDVSPFASSQPRMGSLSRRPLGLRPFSHSSDESWLGWKRGIGCSYVKTCLWLSVPQVGC